VKPEQSYGIGGEIKIVLPADAEEAGFVYPKPAW